MQCNTMQCNTIQHMQYNAIQYNAIHNTIQYNTIQYNSNNNTIQYKPYIHTYIHTCIHIYREGTAGYIISFGDALYRSLDAVEQLKKRGIDVGLINKPTLNVVDDVMMEIVAASKMCLVVEPLGKRTGMGSKFGTWLLNTQHAQNGNTLCKFGHIAVHHEGGGGLWEHAYTQGYDSESVQAKVEQMLM